MRYEHTQFGYVTFGAMLVALVVCAAVAVATRHAAPFVLVAVFGVLLWQMATLTTRVDGRVFECWFGPGLIRRTIPLADVEDVTVVRYAWLYGFGIRLTHRGWMWNVSGLRAVRLRLTNGRHFTVGSDEPDILATAIEAQRTIVRQQG